MSAAALLGWISLALLLQVGVGLGVALRRHQRMPTAREVVPHVGLTPASDASGAWPGWREFRVTQRRFEDPAQTQCSFHLAPADGLPLPAFKPGQYLTFSLPVAALASQAEPASSTRQITRCYSLSDRPDPQAYRVTIKRVPAPAGRPELPPGAASTHFHYQVHEGDVLQARAPAGRFFIDADSALPAVLIAGGIGITPMMSMLRWCLDEQPQRTLHLYYGLRHGAEHAFKPTLEALASAHANFHLNVVYSAPATTDVHGRDHGHVGHIDLSLLQRTLPHGRHQFYVCGPPPMMASLVPALQAWGVRAEDIHHEAFGPASLPVGAEQPTNAALAASAPPMQIRFLRAGRTLEWTGQDANLLDFAERHGIEDVSACARRASRRPRQPKTCIGTA